MVADPLCSSLHPLPVRAAACGRGHGAHPEIAGRAHHRRKRAIPNCCLRSGFAWSRRRVLPLRSSKSSMQPCARASLRKETCTRIANSSGPQIKTPAPWLSSAKCLPMESSRNGMPWREPANIKVGISHVSSSDTPVEAAFRNELCLVARWQSCEVASRAQPRRSAAPTGLTPRYQTLSRKGWVAPHWPKQYGGMGASLNATKQYKRGPSARIRARRNCQRKGSITSAPF